MFASWLLGIESWATLVNIFSWNLIWFILICGSLLFLFIYLFLGLFFTFIDIVVLNVVGFCFEQRCSRMLLHSFYPEVAFNVFPTLCYHHEVCNNMLSRCIQLITYLWLDDGYSKVNFDHVVDMSLLSDKVYSVSIELSLNCMLEWPPLNDDIC